MNATPRTHRILAHLAANPDGCSNHEVIAAIRRHEPDAPSVGTTVLLHYLVRTGQANSTGKYSTRRFFPVPEGDAAARQRTNEANQARRARGLAKSGGKPLKHPDGSLIKKPRPTAPAKIARMPATPVAPTKPGPLDSSTIARDIAAFKRSGGRIEKLPAGASAEPLGFGHANTLPRPGTAVRALIRAQVDNL